MTDRDVILERLDRLEREISGHRTRAHRWRGLALLTLLGVIAVPANVDAAKARSSISLASTDGRQEAEFTAQGFEYRFDGEARLKFDVGETWDRFTMYRQDGSPSISMGTDHTGASLKMFDDDDRVRLELLEKMLGAGSGVRLHDEAGHPRLVLYSGDVDGETGLRMSDSDNQPRVQISAQEDGIAMFRASDSAATSIAEISVLHRSDAAYRQLGFSDEFADHDPLVPMVYMLDPTGTSKLIMPVTPH